MQGRHRLGVGLDRRLGDECGPQILRKRRQRGVLSVRPRTRSYHHDQSGHGSVLRLLRDLPQWRSADVHLRHGQAPGRYVQSHLLSADQDRKQLRILHLDFLSTRRAGHLWLEHARGGGALQQFRSGHTDSASYLQRKRHHHHGSRWPRLSCTGCGNSLGNSIEVASGVRDSPWRVHRRTAGCAESQLHARWLRHPRRRRMELQLRERQVRRHDRGPLVRPGHRDRARTATTSHTTCASSGTTATS